VRGNRAKHSFGIARLGSQHARICLGLDKWARHRYSCNALDTIGQARAQDGLQFGSTSQGIVGAALPEAFQ